MWDVGKEMAGRWLIVPVCNCFGRINVLINKAGIWGRTAPILERTAEEMQQSFGVNTLGAMYGMKYAVPHMKPGSAIINTGSVAGLAGVSGRSEEHTSELQSLMRISYAVFCLKKKTT